jgi:hypothetical protein
MTPLKAAAITRARCKEIVIGVFERAHTFVLSSEGIQKMRDEILDSISLMDERQNKRAGGLGKKAKKKIVASLVFALLTVGSVQAQDTNVPPTVAASWITKAAEYIAANGEASTGIGGTWDALSHGRLSIVANQSIGFWQPFSNKTVCIQMTFGHSSCMAEKTHEGLGLGLSTKVFTIGWLKKAHFLMFTDLSQVHLSVGIYPDIDKAVHGDFSAKTTVSSIRLGFKF